MAKKKIIIIEDDDIVLKALNIKLLKAGYEVLSAADGEIGLEMIRQENPDLVLLDILMPQMNGFQVLTGLKNDPHTKNIPVVILSNLNQEDDIKKGMKLGALDYFVKSTTSLDEILKKIKKVLSKSKKKA